jgi:hypothetical protein
MPCCTNENVSCPDKYLTGTLGSFGRTSTTDGSLGVIP